MFNLVLAVDVSVPLLFRKVPRQPFYYYPLKDALANNPVLSLVHSQTSSGGVTPQSHFPPVLLVSRQQLPTATRLFQTELSSFQNVLCLFLGAVRIMVTQIGGQSDWANLGPSWLFLHSLQSTVRFCLSLICHPPLTPRPQNSWVLEFIPGCRKCWYSILLSPKSSKIQIFPTLLLHETSSGSWLPI